MSALATRISRRSTLQLLAAGAGWAAGAALSPGLVLAQAAPLDQVLSAAAALASLETVMVCRGGEVLAEQGYRGHSVDDPTNIKSASKSVISGLVGAAIDRGALAGVDQRVAVILATDVPDDADPRIRAITVGNLLSMQAGLHPTSGPNYGTWVASDNWVRSALDQPFASDPGGAMLYSTGSSHLLSAILTEVTRRSTLDNAHDWFGAVGDFAIAAWERDPQGIYLGGNEMAMTPRSLLAFGEVYRTGGLAPDGSRVLSQNWIDQSWTARTNSRYSGYGYGYGWFLRTIGGEDVRFAWGYGGQMLYVVPSLDLTVVMTSDDRPRASTISDRDRLHDLLAEIIAAMRSEA